MELDNAIVSKNNNNKKKITISLLIIFVVIIVIVIVILLLNKKKPTPPSTNESYLIANDKKYSINTSGDFCTNRTDSGTFDFTNLEGQNQSIARDQITEIHLTDLPTLTNNTAPDSYLMYMCSEMTNLTVADITIPNTITSVGRDFCSFMFGNCSSLTSLSDNFNLPQNITNVDFEFCASMFSNCGIASLPDGFNIPQGITTVGRQFCSYMFDNCTSLTSLPTGFNLPSGMISVGDYFCTSMFSFTKLHSLPNGFNIPQRIINVGEGFCAGMFGVCNLLKNDSAYLVTITIPTPPQSSNNFCNNMFYECSGMDSSSWSWWPTPIAGSTITINKN